MTTTLDAFPDPTVIARCVWISVMKSVIEILLSTDPATASASVIPPIMKTPSAGWKKNGARHITLEACIVKSFISGGSARVLSPGLPILSVYQKRNTLRNSLTVSRRNLR